MKFMIAGLGSIGRRHLRNLRALGEQDILLFRTHQSTLSEEELAGLPVCTDLYKALAWQPDAVIIANPTSAHLQVALPAAKTGCHLLIEKPISDSMEGVDALTDAMQSNGKRALVGFHFRFHPVLMQIKTLLDTGELGTPLSVRAHWGEYLPGMHPWEDYRGGYAARADLGGGVVLTICHPFDYLRWLIGEIDALSAAVAKTSDLDLKVEDQAEVILHFANGCLGTVHLDYFQRPPSHTFEIILSKGLIRWDNISGEAEIIHAEDGRQYKLLPQAGFERNHMYLEEMKHFLALANGSETISRCSLTDGAKALAVALAVLKSASNQSALITL